MTAPLHVAPDPELHADFTTARERSLAAATPLAAQETELADAAGRVLARTLIAQADLVPFARSAMDGYALHAADVRDADPNRIVTLPLHGGATYAGDALQELPRGFASRIATGAGLPHGADAVVPFELVAESPGAIAVRAPLDRGAHIFAAGDDARIGDVLARAGDIITPGRAGLLAAAGFARVEVRRRPRVVVVSTGDEIVAVTAEPRHGQIRNSNGTMLAAALARDGADVVASTHAGDRADPLRAALQAAIAHADLVITTGGASVGERDLVKAELHALGARFAFTSIAVRPAKPMAVARIGDAVVVVLPGNPAAAYLAYMTFVRGMVRVLAGRSDTYPPRLPALLENGRIRRKEARHFLLFGQLRFADGAFRVRPLDNQCSSLTRAAADANAVVIAAPGTGHIEPDEEVIVEVTDWDAVTFSTTGWC